MPVSSLPSPGSLACFENRPMQMCAGIYVCVCVCVCRCMGVHVCRCVHGCAHVSDICICVQVFWGIYIF
jgi:hypothetical protein